MIDQARSAGMLAALALLALVAACSVPTEGRPQPAGSDTAAGSDAGATGPRPDREIITLGDLNKPPTQAEVGAPFDPCTVLTWADFPASVRPGDPARRPPRARPVAPDDRYEIACLFSNNRATVAVAPDGQPTPSTGSSGMFSALVVWSGKPGGLSVDPGEWQRAASTQYAGRPGLERRTEGEGRPPGCLGIMQLADGFAGVSAVNGVTGEDPCGIARELLEQMASRTP